MMGKLIICPVLIGSSEREHHQSTQIFYLTGNHKISILAPSGIRNLDPSVLRPFASLTVRMV